MSTITHHQVYSTAFRLNSAHEHTTHHGGFDLGGIAEKCMDIVMRAVLWALGRNVGDFLFHRAPYLIVILAAGGGLWWLIRKSRKPGARA